MAAVCSCAAGWAGELEPLSAGARPLFDHARPGAPLVFAYAAQSPQDRVEIITLSKLVERLSRDPKDVEALIEALRQKAGSYGRGWPGLDHLDPGARERLVAAVRGADKSFLDDFPTMSLDGLKSFIAAFGAKQGAVAPEAEPPATQRLTLTGKPRAAEDGAFLKDWGRGLYHGDRTLHNLKTAYGDNVAIADALNHLALNEPGQAPKYTLLIGDRRLADVGSFLEYLLAEGHGIAAVDRRFFANFGGIWFKENERWVSVVTPLFVDTGLRLPSGKKLIVPVTHSHLELSIRGPRVNADVIYYLGVGGAAKFYPLATEDKPWVGGRAAQTRSGRQAVDWAQRAATTRRELKAKVAKYKLPLGGYGPLGVCNDVEAMITGTAIYPQTRDPRYYKDGGSIDAWAAALPVDGGIPPDPKRVYDSLAVQDPDQLEIPQVRELVRELKVLVEAEGRR